jgi:hypothetical protein
VLIGIQRMPIEVITVDGCVIKQSNALVWGQARHGRGATPVRLKNCAANKKTLPVIRQGKEASLTRYSRQDICTPGELPALLTEQLRRANPLVCFALRLWSFNAGVRAGTFTFDRSLERVATFTVLFNVFIGLLGRLYAKEDLSRVSSRSS